MLSILYKIIDFYSILIVVSVLASWIDPMGRMKIFSTIRKLTYPYLKIFRAVISFNGVGIDLSPIIALWILNLIKGLLLRFIYF